MTATPHSETPTPEEAHQIMCRFNASHFNLKEEHARYSIPADPRRDDDIRMSAFIDHDQQLRERLEEVERERDLLKSSDLGFTSTVSPSVEILRPDSVRDFNQAASALSGEAEISDLKTHLEEAQKERDELKACFRESMKTRLKIERECAQSTARAKLLEQLLNRAESLNAKLAEALERTNKFLDEEVYREVGGQEEPSQPADELSHKAASYIRPNNDLLARYAATKGTT